MDKISVQIQECLELLQSDRDAGISELYLRCGKYIQHLSLLKVKNKDDAYDVMQNVLLKLMHLPADKLPIGNSKAWMDTLIRNEAMDYLRKRRIHDNIDDLAEIADTESFEEHSLSKLDHDRLLSILTHFEKKTVELKINDDLTFKEIGNRQNTSESRIKYTYYKAITKLRLAVLNMVFAIISGISLLIRYKIVSDSYRELNPEHEPKPDFLLSSDLAMIIMTIMIIIFLAISVYLYKLSKRVN